MGGNYRGVVFVDVDGTLTIDRSSATLDLDAIEYCRELVRKGFLVVLTSGNSLPVLRGLSLYLGLGGIVVAENGAVVYTNGVKVVCEGCDEVCRAYEYVVKVGGNLLVPTWQNLFRLCDKAFKWRVKEEEALEFIRNKLGELGYRDLRVASSGYAIHIIPKECGKDVGMKAVINDLKLHNIPKYCIGDSVTDVPMSKVCDELVAVSNADEELKKVATKVLSKPSSKGFIEYVKELISRLEGNGDKELKAAHHIQNGAGVAQPVERRAVNPVVGGSNPPPGAKQNNFY